MLYAQVLNEHELYAELAEFPDALTHLYEVCNVAACVGADNIGYLVLADHKKGNYYLYTLFPTDQVGFSCEGPCGGTALLALVDSGELEVPAAMVGFVTSYVDTMRRQVSVEKALLKPLTEAFYAASMSVAASYVVSRVSLGYGPMNELGLRQFGLIVYFKVNQEDFDESVLEEVWESAKKNVQQILLRSGWVIEGDADFTVVEGYTPSLFIMVKVNKNRHQQQRSLLQ